VEFTVLLDAPGKPVSRIQIAKLGDFSDSRYGDFAITRDNVASWQKNLSKLPGGEALIDFEHRSERKPRDSSAAGWISGIDLDGDKVMADTRWTPRGQKAIADEEYRFLSPVFGPSVGADNEHLDDALPSVALTNKPFLGMPAVMLASAERVSAALEDDPAARFYTRALGGQLGEDTQALVMLDVPQAERDKAHDAGNSLPDKSYPINNVKQLKAAATLAASGHGNVAAAKKLIRRRAKELGVDLATLAGFGQDSSDSRRAMDTALLTALGIEDAETLKVLEAVDIDEQHGKVLLDAANALKAKAEEHEPGKLTTLEQQAADAGKVVLDAGQFEKFAQRAKDGAAALDRVKTLESSLKTLEDERADERFEHTFDAALNDPAGARVAPAEKDQLKHFFTLDADATLKLIEDRKPIVHAKPLGAPALELDAAAEPEQVMAAGIHPDSHTLDQKIRKYMLDKQIGPARYGEIAEQVMDGRLAL
jgi:phage I-like protein